MSRHRHRRHCDVLATGTVSPPITCFCRRFTSPPQHLAAASSRRRFTSPPQHLAAASLRRRFTSPPPHQPPLHLAAPLPPLAAVVASTLQNAPTPDRKPHDSSRRPRHVAGVAAYGGRDRGVGGHGRP